MILLNNPQDIFSVAPTYYFCTYLRAAMLWGCGRNPGPVPGTQTKWASFEASAVSDLPPEKCLRVFLAERLWVPVMHQTCWVQQKSVFNYGASWTGARASRSREGTTDGPKGTSTHQSSPPSTGCPLWLRGPNSTSTRQRTIHWMSITNFIGNTVPSK